MSGAKHRRKGSRVERQLVTDLMAIGIAAQRVPLSGAALGRFAGDVVATSRVGELTIECKARRGGSGFAVLERWLGANDVLMLKRDRQDALFVVSKDTFLKLLNGGANGSNDEDPPADDTRVGNVEPR